jgi:hypothetical protein
MIIIKNDSRRIVFIIIIMVFFLSKALVSVAAVIAGVFFGIKAFHNRLIVDKVRQERFV